jgi:hypothetical protein
MQAIGKPNCFSPFFCIFSLQQDAVIVRILIAGAPDSACLTARHFAWFPQAIEDTTLAHHRAIFAAVQSAFGGGHSSARALCGDTPLTLASAAVAPTAGMRRMVS